MASAFPIPLLLPRPENNGFVPRVHLWNEILLAKPIIAWRDSCFFLSFSDSNAFNLAHSHSCSLALQTFVSRVPFQGLSDYIFYCIETKSHLELLVSTVSGLWFPGSPARPPIKSHPPHWPSFLSAPHCLYPLLSSGDWSPCSPHPITGIWLPCPGRTMCAVSLY